MNVPGYMHRPGGDAKPAAFGNTVYELGQSLGGLFLLAGRIAVGGSNMVRGLYSRQGDYNCCSCGCTTVECLPPVYGGCCRGSCCCGK